MCTNKKIWPVIIALALFSIKPCAAQTTEKKKKVKPIRNYSLVMYAGGGVSSYVSNINPDQFTGLNTRITKTSPAATLRVMWHPNHRLRLGLETGFTNLYSYVLADSTTKGKVSLSAVPVLIVWSIPVFKRFNFFAGFGSYILTSKLNFGGKVTSRAVSLGSNVAINYVQPLSKKLGIASEIKWMNAFQTKDNALTLQIHLMWKFLEY